MNTPDLERTISWLGRLVGWARLALASRKPDFACVCLAQIADETRRLRKANRKLTAPAKRRTPSGGADGD